MQKIFISCNWDNLEIESFFRKLFVELGFEVIDIRRPGRIQENMDKAIKECDIFCAVLTKKPRNKEYVGLRYEWVRATDEAKNRGIPIIVYYSDNSLLKKMPHSEYYSEKFEQNSIMSNIDHIIKLVRKASQVKREPLSIGEDFIIEEKHVIAEIYDWKPSKHKESFTENIILRSEQNGRIVYRTEDDAYGKTIFSEVLSHPKAMVTKQKIGNKILTDISLEVIKNRKYNIISQCIQEEPNIVENFLDDCRCYFSRPTDLVIGIATNYKTIHESLAVIMKDKAITFTNLSAYKVKAPVFSEIVDNLPILSPNGKTIFWEINNPEVGCDYYIGIKYSRGQK